MPRYVALSYVWGTCPVLRLLKSNVESLGKDGALWKEKLPKTITDALDLVNRLEEHYLWVDALCITQDDPEEMQSSIPCMNTIYQTASLTVIAAAGNSADAGLPGLRPGTRWHAPKNFEVGPLRYITSSTSTRDQFEFLQGSYWSTRGWTFQEGHLSRRRLVFTNEQVFWSCSKFSRCEEVRLEDTNRFYPFSTSEASEMVPGNLDVDDRPAVWQDKCLKYYIDGYSYKSLSHDDTDRLNAFKGMISYVAGATKDRFFGGLPCSYFGEKLIWEVFPEQFFEKDWDHTVTKSLPTLQRRHKYPSWSWLDWKGHVYFFYEKESYEPRQIGFYRLENSELIHINSEGSRNRRRNYEYTNNGSGYRAKIPLDEAPQEVRPTVESASHFADYDGFKSLQRDPRIFFYTQSAILNFKPRDCTSKKIMTWEDLRDARTTTTVEGVGIVFSSSSFQHWGYDGPREFIVINQTHLLQETDPDNGLISNDRLTLMEISWKDSTAYRETLATVNEADWRKKVPNVQRKRISLG
ncbi:heterokaryon incompatibility protein [Colletotrichum truncatum]|uniref:Heterokaryon incompatibility protein n=1 Tax=Colletotrichum truncatum TaxID=5467 RepID=A0ACC3YN02_COLTU|nr:heterokaryon incompatibility protein [Colletotrichum truncatum]KAF6789624.1 heterokaryon incompatibility protein [Colletotrichum truncatum]